MVVLSLPSLVPTLGQTARPLSKASFSLGLMTPRPADTFIRQPSPRFGYTLSHWNRDSGPTLLAKLGHMANDGDPLLSDRTIKWHKLLNRRGLVLETPLNEVPVVDLVEDVEANNHLQADTVMGLLWLQAIRRQNKPLQEALARYVKKRPLDTLQALLATGFDPELAPPPDSFINAFQAHDRFPTVMEGIGRNPNLKRLWPTLMTHEEADLSPVEWMQQRAPEIRWQYHARFMAGLAANVSWDRLTDDVPHFLTKTIEQGVQQSDQTPETYITEGFVKGIIESPYLIPKLDHVTPLLQKVLNSSKTTLINRVFYTLIQRTDYPNNAHYFEPLLKPFLDHHSDYRQTYVSEFLAGPQVTRWSKIPRTDRSRMGNDPTISVRFNDCQDPLPWPPAFRAHLGSFAQDRDPDVRAVLHHHYLPHVDVAQPQPEDLNTLQQLIVDPQDTLATQTLSNLAKHPQIAEFAEPMLDLFDYDYRTNPRHQEHETITLRLLLRNPRFLEAPESLRDYARKVYRDHPMDQALFDRDLATNPLATADNAQFLRKSLRYSS